MASKGESTSGERSLSERFEWELKKRSTPAGIAEAAIAGGDRDALAKFAGLALVAIENPDSDMARGVLFWLEGALSDIAAGKEPNKAFGWKRAGKGRPGGAFDTLFKRWIVGDHMRGLLANNPGMSQEEAAALVAEDRHVSEKTALDCYRECVGK